jgi:iron uptake system component EfeO
MRAMPAFRLAVAVGLSAAVLIAGCGVRPSTQGASGATGAVPASLHGVTEKYRAYAIAQCDALVKGTRLFAAAISAGDIAQAKKLYATTRMSYERIEPIAESLGQLDPDIDARESDVPEADWRGFHRIERALWTGQEKAQVNGYAQKLLSDVTLLRAKLDGVEISVGGLAVGAVELLNEVSRSKITGEEERYSHTDLYDFAANVEGAQEIFLLLQPFVKEKDPALEAKTAQAFQGLLDDLDHHRKGTEYALYTELGAARTRALARAVDALADSLAKVGATN